MSSSPFIRGPFEVIGMIELKDPKHSEPDWGFVHYVWHRYLPVESEPTNYRGMFTCDIKGCPVTKILRRERRNYMARQRSKR